MPGPRSLLAPPPRTEPFSAKGRPAVPVTLLTGFLGAGKTTLLNRILAGNHQLRVGVLVNDFGAVNIDSALVDSLEENTVSLVNGCVCCEIREDLVASLEQITRRSDRLDHVLLEASGVADPEGIVMTLLDPRYGQLLRLDSVICVVDAEAIFAQGDDDRLSALKLRQIAFADLVVLNKTDVVRPELVAVVKDWVDVHVKRIRIIEAAYGEVPLEILLASGRFDARRWPARGAQPEPPLHGPGGAAFDRWSYRTHRLFSAEALRRMVKRELPASVYRCKGIVFTEGEPSRPCAFQVVGRRVELTALERAARLDAPASEIVAIGRGIDPRQLDRLFEACHSSP